MNILEVKELKKYFPIRRGLFYKTVGYVKAVDGVSFLLNKGKTLGIVGESGSGKTTLARLIVRLMEPNEGQIFLKGAEITHFSERKFRSSRKFVQIVFQDPFGSLDPRFTVDRIVGEGMELLGSGVAERREKIKQLMGMVGLSQDALGRFPHEFSGGQRQRISIARALAAEPELLILDEPVSSLDLSIQAQVINLLLELQDKFNLTYIFIAHDLRVVRHVSDEICVMYRGKILEKASSNEIFKNPLHPYTKLLLSAIPLLGRKRDLLEEVKVEAKAKVEVKAEVKIKENRCRFLERCPEKDKICVETEPELQEVLPGHFVSCLKKN